MFLGKGVLKICSKLNGEHPCQRVISIKFIEITLENTFLKEHLTQGRLLTVAESDQRTVKSLFYLNLYLSLIKATEIKEFQI